ncbi:MAG TPA: glycosyltransferase family 2 protein, partial [Archaeoglobus profundus]|nr:glycosyltransferase family 2 protein [Archaeoglobus profundus]
MKKNPLISIVMSVYNGEKYLVESMESILDQTYRNFEFIIIDDGSTDSSLQIIQSYREKDNRIILISRENKGLPYSLNEGIRLSKGKYIARMDADDISLPRRLEEQIIFMEKNRDIGICGCSILDLDTNSKWILTSYDKRLKVELLFLSAFAHPSVMIDRKMMIENNLFYNETFFQSQDFELWTRMAEHTKFANLKTPLLRYRILEDSISRVADKNIEERYLVIKSIFEIYLKQMDIQNTEEENRLHFNLTVNTRMKDNAIEFSHLKKYFSKIVRANNEKQVFDKIELKKVLGKK